MEKGISHCCLLFEFCFLNIDNEIDKLESFKLRITRQYFCCLLNSVFMVYWSGGRELGRIIRSYLNMTSGQLQVKRHTLTHFVSLVGEVTEVRHQKRNEKLDLN